MSERVMLEYGGAYEIDPHKDGVFLEVFDADHGDVSGLVKATPAEWDAFVAAGNRALGRVSSDLADRIATEQGPPVDLFGICSEGREEDVYGLGYAKGRADAAAMVRAAGPMVPRAAVAAVVAEMERWYTAHNEAAKTREDASVARYQEGKTHGILRCLDAVRALLSLAPTRER